MFLVFIGSRRRRFNEIHIFNINQGCEVFRILIFLSLLKCIHRSSVTPQFLMSKDPSHLSLCYPDGKITQTLSPWWILFYRAVLYFVRAIRYQTTGNNTREPGEGVDLSNCCNCHRLVWILRETGSCKFSDFNYCEDTIGVSATEIFPLTHKWMQLNKVNVSESELFDG